MKTLIVAFCLACCGCTGTFMTGEHNGNPYRMMRLSLGQKLDVAIKTPDGLEVKYLNDGGTTMTREAMAGMAEGILKGTGIPVK
jgi:hypothetical protein